MKKQVIFLVVGAALLSAMPAPAQMGPWSQANPLWTDKNANGRIDEGERGVYLRLVNGSPDPTPTPTVGPTVGPTPVPTVIIFAKALEASRPVSAAAQPYYVIEGNPADPGNTYDTKLYPDRITNPTSIVRRCDSNRTVSQTLTTSDGHSFAFVEMRGGSQTGTGSGVFADINQDGAFDVLRVAGVNKGQVVQADLGLVYKDTTGDGKADWVSIPWALSGILGVPTGDPQIWLPLTADAAGRPTTVNVKVPDPANPEQFAGIDFVLPIVPASQGGPDNRVVPTLSGMGLLGLAVALGVAGVVLIRGRVLG